ncbi:DUF3105 domain-containing protein, partial [Candidatus Microgenomates bacterium]|nr:DUF3105 domain-containing protein [Candidatus Microgenomates bacterium]
YAQPADWGVAEEPMTDETFIHNLEHGGIVITYRPDLPQDQIDKLKDLYFKLPPSSLFNSRKAVVVARPANERPISLAAWGYLQHLDNFDEGQIVDFYNSHLDKGPETAP